MPVENEVIADEATVVPDTNAPVDDPEVTDQEPEETHEETLEEKVARLEKEAHGKQKRIDKLSSQKRMAHETAMQYKQRLEQYDNANGQKPQRSPEEIINERARIVEKETEALVTIKSFAKQDDKFVTNLQALAEEAGSLLDDRGLPSPLLEQILECDKPTKVVAYLVKHPEIAAELEGLSPTRLAKKLVLIENGMSQAPKTSNAPPPIKPIGSSGRGTTKPVDDMSMDEYIAHRKKQGARWAR